MPHYTYRLDPDLSDNPRFLDLVRHWDSKRAGRPLPLRADIDPLDLRTHLGSLNLIECLPGYEDFRYRLIGTKITEAYGRDSTGRTVRELYAESDVEYRDFLLAWYRDVSLQQKIGRAEGTLRPVNREFRNFDSLLLPLANDTGAVGWILNEVTFL